MSRADEPMHPVSHDPSGNTFYGLTIREHFAAMAMQGLCANSAVAEATKDWRHGLDDVRKRLAEAAVATADALIAELAKERS